jgi:tetratricopeptide (TPR) repeat protein
METHDPAYRESLESELDSFKTIYPAYRRMFGKKYGGGGLLVCSYADVLARATIEDGRVRDQRELPASLDEIKSAIIDTMALAVGKEEQHHAWEALGRLYRSLARFLPALQAALIRQRNQALFSGGEEQLGPHQTDEAEQIEADVKTREDKFFSEFRVKLRIKLELEAGRLHHDHIKRQREAAAGLIIMRHFEPASVVETMVKELRASNPGPSPEYCALEGILAWEKGDRNTAHSNFTKWIELDPDDAVALSNRGDLRIEMGDFEGALVDLEKARELNPKEPCENLDLLKGAGPAEREALRQKILKGKPAK